MRHARWFTRRTALVRSVALALVATPTVMGVGAGAQTPVQSTVPSPQEAMTALVAARSASKNPL